MSKMKEVAALLGVEMGEEFGITNYQHMYRITEQQIESRTRGAKCWYETDGEAVYSVLTGRSTIIKKPWKPKEGEKYFTVLFYGIEEYYWDGDISDLTLYATGNCFKTRAEAKKNKNKISNYLTKIYEDGKPLVGADEWRDKE